MTERYERSVLDTEEDKTIVIHHAGDDIINVTSIQADMDGGDSDVTYMTFTPEQARRLARVLKKAAKRAEASQ